MNAEDTVITNQDALDLVEIPCETCKVYTQRDCSRGLPLVCKECQALQHRRAQAKVSFKVGVGKGRNDTVEKIDTMLSGTELHLCWYTKGGEVINYGLADEHGDEVDVESVVIFGKPPEEEATNDRDK